MIDLRHGDCLDIMKSIPDQSIDAIITDPPYKLTTGGMKSSKSFKVVFNQAKQDSLKNSRKQFFDIPKFDDWITVLYNKAKDGCHFYCMSNQKNLNDILNVGIKSGFKILNILVWDKGCHVPLPYYMQSIEFIVLFRKGFAKKINNKGTKALIAIKGIIGNKIHVSEKPVNLFKIFIENSTKENEIILDPFMGSGTAGVACLNTNRHFIGIEKDDTYFKIASERINNHIVQCTLL